MCETDPYYYSIIALYQLFHQNGFDETLTNNDWKTIRIWYSKHVPNSNLRNTEQSYMKNHIAEGLE